MNKSYLLTDYNATLAPSYDWKTSLPLFAPQATGWSWAFDGTSWILKPPTSLHQNRYFPKLQSISVGQRSDQVDMVYSRSYSPTQAATVLLSRLSLPSIIATAAATLLPITRPATTRTASERPTALCGGQLQLFL